MKIKRLLALMLTLACILTMLASCGANQESPDPTDEQTDEATQSEKVTTPVTDDSDDEDTLTPDVELKSLGEDIVAAGINNGKFEGDTTTADFTVTYLSGTEGAYLYDDSTKTLTFHALSADSAYSISGKLNGNIIVNVGSDYSLELELAGLSLRSSSAEPIKINSAKEVELSVKKDTKNYIYDERTEANGSAVSSKANLTLCGSGELFVSSASNNGICTDKSLNVKDLALVVESNDKALGGKNSVTLENCSTLLVAKSGDAIKTEATKLSTDGKQNGNICIYGGTHTICASNDGIEAAYDVIIDYGSYIDEATNEKKTVATAINVYTDKYSSYTSETAHDAPDLETRELYVCHTSEDYKYSVKLTNADGSKSEWVDPVFYESIKSGRRTYYTYKFYVKPEYSKMQVFVYSKEQVQQNNEVYSLKSDLVDIKSDSDTYRYSGRRWEWKAYSSLVQGGNNGEKNPDAPTYSAKGIRAANAVTISAGVLKISAVDNAISTKNQVALENGKSPAGDIIIDSADITLASKCSGIYADGTLTVNGGNVNVLSAFEGLKANRITVNDGNISVKSTNDGIKATAKSGTGITVSGGEIYVLAGAYGINASSEASYNAIAFNSGDMVIIAPATNKSAIYSAGGYTYTDGRILAILNKEGNRDSTTHYYSFSRVGKIQELELTENACILVEVDGSEMVSAKIPSTFSAIAVYIGDKLATISTTDSISDSANHNGVIWTE